jgi:hypothetical protein
LAILDALRPRTTVEQLWPSGNRDAAYQAIIATDPAAEVVVPRRPSHRTRRLATVAALSVLAVPGGLGVASAAGILPESFVGNYRLWQQDTGVDPATMTRAGTAPGPDGTVFTVWTAKNPSNDYLCIAPVFESAASAAAPAPSVFEESGNGCQVLDLKMAFGENKWITSANGRHTFAVTAGDSTRAALRLHDGSVRPVIRVEGNYVGWFDLPTGQPTPVLIAYDDAGAIMAQTTLSTER